MRTRTIVYVNVGNLPSGKVQDHVKRIKEEFEGQLIKFPEDQVIYFPVRDRDSGIEVLVYPES